MEFSYGQTVNMMEKKLKRAEYGSSGKMWIYSRKDDFFYILDYSRREFMDKIVDNKSLIYRFFNEILSLLGEKDYEVRWIARYRERNDAFICFYCCYKSQSFYGSSYVVLLVFRDNINFNRDIRYLAFLVNLMRKIWVYLPTEVSSD